MSTRVLNVRRVMGLDIGAFFDSIGTTKLGPQSGFLTSWKIQQNAAHFARGSFQVSSVTDVGAGITDVNTSTNFNSGGGNAAPSACGQTFDAVTNCGIVVVDSISSSVYRVAGVIVDAGTPNNTADNPGVSGIVYGDYAE